MPHSTLRDIFPARCGRDRNEVEGIRRRDFGGEEPAALRRASQPHEVEQIEACPEPADKSKPATTPKGNRAS